MKKIYLLPLLLIPTLAFAVPKEIVITGSPGLGHGNNTEFFGFPNEPVPFEFRLQFDTEGAIDGDPLADRGEYEFDGLPVSLSFGQFTFETTDTEIEVYVGRSGLWGFTFANEHAFDVQVNGQTLHIGDYGLYASFLSPFQQHIDWVPNDSLANLHDGFFASFTNYVSITGLTDGNIYTRFQQTTSTSTPGAGFTVSNVVPEPSTAGCLILGAGLLAVRRRRL